MKKQEIREVVEDVLRDELHGLLHDVTYRIGVLREEQKHLAGLEAQVTSGRLNLAQHLLDGFSFTDNSPGPGSVAWVDCSISYKGETYAITDGDTSDKYIWWDFSATPNTVFQESATKPTLEDDDVLIAINTSGVHTMVIGTGRMVNGSGILDSTVNTTELANSAVTSDKLSSAAVTAGKIATGGISNSNQFANGVVNSDQLASGAVTNAKIGSGEVAANNLDIANHLLF